MSAKKARLAVLISGNGSNLQAIIEAVKLRVLPAEIVVVVSNRKDAFGLQRAEQAHIPTLYFPLKPYSDAGRPRSEYDADLVARLREYDPDWVVLAGWMHILSNGFLRHFLYRVVNLHPALPGQFPGAHAIADALAAYKAGKIKHTGCMVHLVADEGVDNGPILGVADVAIYPTDDEAALAARMHGAEHTLLIQSLLRLVEGDEEIEEEIDEDGDIGDEDDDDWEDDDE